MEPLTLLLSFLIICICLYHFVISKMTHFERLKVPHEPPIPFLGNMMPYVLGRMSVADNLHRVYNLFPDAKYFGFYEFMTPTFVIRDPELINTIAIKNFENFCDHRHFLNEDIEPLASKNLFALRGDHWREMRKLLSPSFTSSKMKMMFQLMCPCADNLTNFLVSDSKVGKTYDMYDVMCRFANDVIATCAFGISLDSFKDSNNEFFLLGKTMNVSTKMTIKLHINKHFPWLAKLLGLRVFSAKVENFFKDLVADTVKARDEQGFVRPDMIQLMMETRSKNSGPSFDIDEMTAQAFVFFLGGFDSVATMMCFAAHEVGVNPDIQSKLRAEIEDVVERTNGQPTYEAICGMKYLDAVVNEVLRMYPLGSFNNRLCVKKFELPPATPDREPVTVKPGDDIWFPLYSMQHDPKYYPEPNEFNPDRFYNDQVDNMTYMPFGIGPRICIANRFALMEAKIMLFYLLWRCDLEPSVRTKVPMVLNKKSLFTTADGGFWLKIRGRKSAILNRQ